MEEYAIEAVMELVSGPVVIRNPNLGFATGFWGVIGVLVLKKQWRRNLFRSAEEIFDKIYVIFVVGVAKIKRRRKAA
ncbi:hypothetical protein LXL04_021801 [Taraxacum kok-saghyz]